MGTDNQHKTDFIDIVQVTSGSISENEDCRPCDLKEEFNRQINASSAIIIIVGDKTDFRMAGSGCQCNVKQKSECSYTLYKQNTKGSEDCKVSITEDASESADVGCINQYSYLFHKFRRIPKRNKTIIILYNSLNKQPSWIPDYLSDYEDEAHLFWKKNRWGNKVGDY